MLLFSAIHIELRSLHNSCIVLEMAHGVAAWFLTPFGRTYRFRTMTLQVVK